MYVQENMKKILFVIPEYSHGGTNKSLENLLGLIDKEKYGIFIYCLYEDGDDYYKRLFAPYMLKKSRLYYWLHDNMLTRKIIGLLNKVTRRDNFVWLYKYETRYLQEKYCFDCVIAYQEGMATKFVSFFSKPTKIAWTHGIDFERRNRNIPQERAYYEQGRFSHIVCVSETAAVCFRKEFPQLANITIGIHNVVDADKINHLAQNILFLKDYDPTIFNIISIGRYNWVKRFDLIPSIARKVCDIIPDVKFKWYIIGSGEETYEETKEGICKNKVEDIVIQIPAQDNPYPFIKSASLLVSTSVMESFSYVIAEAKTLHVPVLSVDFPVAHEVLPRTCGWICPINEFSYMLSRIIMDRDQVYTKMCQNIRDKDSWNEQSLECLYAIL